jgi:hypothetical protein
MVLIAVIALVWVLCLAIGATFGIIAKIIWIAILFTVASAIWHFIRGKNGS